MVRRKRGDKCLTSDKLLDIVELFITFVNLNQKLIVRYMDLLPMVLFGNSSELIMIVLFTHLLLLQIMKKYFLG